ncbi:eosinophil peroxidase-like [Dendronephthya gigantea]|uniref:eosinophil peroxidase-like n=1 Tax=Dendronephthya gigantea TaxID=151771 RepID=UPI00106C54DD|nr:eosinophil peroxidase-like [Dendronephthya gigantea]
MGIMNLISVVVFLAFISPSQSARYSQQCIISEIARENEIIYRFKTPEEASIFSIEVTDSSYRDTFSLSDANKGTIKLAKSFLGILNWRTDKTCRIMIVLTQTKGTEVINTIDIEFIVLKEGFANDLLPRIIENVKNLAKPSNPFRPTTNTFPWPKKFHRILLQGTAKSKNTSLAECNFGAAINQLFKLILAKLEVNIGVSDIHIGPQGILTPEKLEELIEETGCIPENEEPKCPRETLRYRTFDGTCNNQVDPTAGSAPTGFNRFLPAIYYDAEGLNEPPSNQPNAPDLPNPSTVTELFIIIQSKNQLNRDGISHMFMQFGQFLDHDMTLAPESENGDVCEDIPCNGSSADFTDPCFAILPASGRPCIRLIRSAARCPINGFKLLPREQMNVNTAYLDASMVYGSSESVANALRDLTNAPDDLGLLRTSGANLLPIDNSQLGEPLSLCENLGSCFLAGDVRVNEQAALAAMHTLWVREHNDIATRLRSINPHWNGERIYQETRKILGALVQQITYEEWLPILIGRNVLPRYRDFRTDVNAGITNAFATAAFRLGHSLVRPKFEFLKSDFKPFPFSPIPLRQVFFNNTQTQRSGIDGWIIGMIGNVSQEMDNEMAIGLTNELFQRDNREGLNLAALNMQRGREHGLPFYSDFLAECGRRFPELYPVNVTDVRSFDQINELFRPEVFVSIKEVYRNKPQATDLFTAGISEKPRNVNFRRARFDDVDPILGPTFTCLLIDQFARLRDGDRFFYRNRGVFTPKQLRSIEKRRFSDIICNNVNVVSVPRKAFFVDAYRSCTNRDRRMNLNPWKERVTSCRQSPCRNEGICRSFRSRRVSRVHCVCPREFKGKFCQLKRVSSNVNA